MIRFSNNNFLCNRLEIHNELGYWVNMCQVFYRGNSFLVHSFVSNDRISDLETKEYIEHIIKERIESLKKFDSKKVFNFQDFNLIQQKAILLSFNQTSINEIKTTDFKNNELINLLNKFNSLDYHYAIYDLQDNCYLVCLYDSKLRCSCTIIKNKDYELAIIEGFRILFSNTFFVPGLVYSEKTINDFIFGFSPFFSLDVFNLFNYKKTGNIELEKIDIHSPILNEDSLLFSLQAECLFNNKNELFKEFTFIKSELSRGHWLLECIKSNFSNEDIIKKGKIFNFDYSEEEIYYASDKDYFITTFIKEPYFNFVKSIIFENI